MIGRSKIISSGIEAQGQVQDHFIGVHSQGQIKIILLGVNSQGQIQDYFIGS